MTGVGLPEKILFDGIIQLIASNFLQLVFVQVNPHFIGAEPKFRLANVIGKEIEVWGRIRLQGSGIASAEGYAHQPQREQLKQDWEEFHPIHVPEEVTRSPN